MFLITKAIQRAFKQVGGSKKVIRPFILSDIGEGIQEVQILSWKVKEGDVVREFDPICEVQSDKACVEITSKYDGIISKLNFKEGDVCPVGKSLLSIETNSNPEELLRKTPDKSMNDTEEYKDHQLSIFERGMMKKMQESLSIPHFYLHDHIKLKKTPKNFMVIFIKALSNCLLEFPRLNAHYLPDQKIIREWRSHNISIAIDTKMGLQIPTLRNCNLKEKNDINKELSRLKKISFEGKLGQTDLSDGTITISNIGSLKKGGMFANPLIVAPQVIIIALMPINPNNFEVPISIGADHRVIDGALLLKFLSSLGMEINELISSDKGN